MRTLARVLAGAVAVLAGLTAIASWYAAIWVEGSGMTDRLFGTGFLSILLAIGAAFAASELLD